MNSIEFNTHTKLKPEKNGDKDEKMFYKLMNNGVYSKTRENLRNRIDVKLINNKKVYLKYTLKPNSMLQKIFDKNLVAIRKRKFPLKLNKSSNTGTCILK